MQQSCDTPDNVSQLSLSEQDFNKAVNRTKMRSKTVNIAHEVIVRGFNPISVAKKYGVSVQWVNNACDRILVASDLDFIGVTFQIPLEIRYDITNIVDSCVRIYQAKENQKGE